MFAIEDNIPPPVPTKGRPQLYPYDRLEVGQSFFVPNGDYRTISTCARRWGRSNNRSFVARTINGGVRLWRTA